MSQYYVIVNKQQQGPYDVAALVEGSRAGTFPAGTPVWSEGMSDWQPIETVVAGADAPAPVRASSAAPAAQAPAKAKKISVKKWGIIGGAAALAVLALIIAYICLMPKSFSSDQDIKDYLDNRLAAVKKFDSETAKDLKKPVSELKKWLKDPKDEQQIALAAVMAACGEKGAMVYFFEKKDFSTMSADAAYLTGAAAGHKQVMSYLKKHVSDAEDLAGPAFVLACCTGQVDTCKYLVSEYKLDLDSIDCSYVFKMAAKFGQDIPTDAAMFLGGSRDASTIDKNQILTVLLMLPEEVYDGMAKGFSVARGEKVKKSDCMANVAAVAEYLVAQGAELDKDNEIVNNLLEDCANSALKKAVKK